MRRENRILTPRNSLAKMNPYIPGRSIESVAEDLGITDIIKMASNENPLGCPLTLKQFESSFNKVHYYANKETELPLLRKLAFLHNVALEQVILGNGSDEIIQMTAMAFLNPGEEVITSQHTFSQYTFVTHQMDGNLIETPMLDYTYDLSAIASKINKKTRLIFIANPNNPTGTIVTHQDFLDFLRRVPAHIVVLVDEAYCHYVDDPDYPDTIGLIKKFPNLIVTRTFSKIYGMAGLRVGYGLGQKALIQTLAKVKPPFNMNSIGLFAAEKVLNNDDHIKKSLKTNQSGKDYLYKELKSMSIEFIKTEANFICLFFNCQSSIVFEALLKFGVIVRSLTSFGFENGIRVTIGPESYNKRFIQALKNIMSEIE
ncbi:histidinol-phosphate transaminase [Thermoproteota archaeon]